MPVDQLTTELAALESALQLRERSVYSLDLPLKAILKIEAFYLKLRHSRANNERLRTRQPPKAELSADGLSISTANTTARMLVMAHTPRTPTA